MVRNVLYFWTCHIFLPCHCACKRPNSKTEYIRDQRVRKRTVPIRYARSKTVERRHFLFCTLWLPCRQLLIISCLAGGVATIRALTWGVTWSCVGNGTPWNNGTEIIWNETPPIIQMLVYCVSFLPIVFRIISPPRDPNRSCQGMHEIYIFGWTVHWVVAG